MSDAGVRLVADGLAFPEGPTVLPDGSILVSEMAAGRLRRIDTAGVATTFAEIGGGPNGIAMLGDGRFVVCQSGGSAWGTGPWPRPDPAAVEIFRPIGPAPEPVTPGIVLVDRDGTWSTLAAEFRALDGSTRSLSRPSDVCADGLGGFYLTDGGAQHGRTREVTGVLYGTTDGQVREVVFPLEMPNGVALSPADDRLYVAETRTRRVWEFTIVAPGVVGGGRGFCTVPSGGPLNYGGADGLCVDGDGNVIVASLGTGGVTVFAPDGELLGAIELDDPMTTNAALSADGDTLFVTLASSGRLVAIDHWWRRLSLLV